MLLLTLAAAVLLIITAVYTVADPRRRAVISRRFRQRRTTEAFTPPRSLSPEKKGLPSTQSASYTDVFPPHRRDAFAALQGRTRTKPSYAKTLSDAQPIDESHADHVTATGFTVAEIKALGDFPDYAALSGVPLPAPYHEFDIAKAQPRPYRPFRWAYHQTMSLTKMEPDWWLELESTYASRIAQRQDLVKQYGDMVMQALPGSEIAIKELMEMCLQFLCARYPHYFRLSADKTIFHNGILQTESHLKLEAPLQILLNNVPEDFACMLREPETGLYTFRAGIICSSLGWNVGSKIGLKLHEIHSPIPDYKEKMQFSMDRYFAKKPTDKPIQRGSWGLEIDEPLFMPPGDPHEKLRDVQDPSHTIDRCRLRVDWQTLRRLPLSGSIVFNFKAVFTPVTEFREEPFIPSLLATVLRQGKKSLMDYKNTWHTEHVVLPAMLQYEQEQVAAGLIPADWAAHTLEEAPYFPDWEEKWHAQQGFKC